MHKQSSIIVGLVLILAGVLFLLLQAFPELASQIDLADQWPLIIVGIGEHDGRSEQVTEQQKGHRMSMRRW